MEWELLQPLGDEERRDVLRLDRSGSCGHAGYHAPR
jgi:hypothetical protein